MADALSDLRYISRMGYRDPWAEATKNITDSLLAYGQSKLKRDMLIASVAKDDAARAERKESEQLKSDRFAFSQLKDSYEDQKDFIENDQSRAARIFGSDLGASTALETAIKGIDYKSKQSDYSNEARNPKNTYEVRLQNFNDGLNLATTNKDSPTAQTYRNEITNLKNNYLRTEKTNFLTTFAEEGEEEGWLSEGDFQSVTDALDKNTPGIAETILNRRFSENASQINSLERRYVNEKNKIISTYIEDGVNTNPEEYNKQLNSLNTRIRSALSPKWKNSRESLENIFFKIEQGQEPLKVQQKKKKDDDSGDKILTNVINQNVLSDNPEEQVFSPDSRVMITNKITGQEQLVTGSVANSLKNNMNATFSASKTSAMKSYVPLDVSREPSLTIPRGAGDVRRVNERLSFKKQNNTQAITPLQTGSEVIDIKTGKRHKVIVKQVDVSKKKYYISKRHGDINLSLEQPYKYVVDGKSYSLDEFKDKFGVPLFSEIKTDSTGTRFSTQRLKATEVIPPIK
jgi:hypothetical protein